MFIRLSLLLALAFSCSLPFAPSAEAAPRKARPGHRTTRGSSPAASSVQEADPPVLVQPGLPQPPAIAAKSAIILDPRSGRVLYDKGAEIPRQAASMQKLLTALLVAEAGRLGDPVTVGWEDTLVEPSKLGLRAGETYRRDQLLQALLVKSANDAAVTLARGHSGSVAAFAQEMNAKARSLGATNSYFVNPNGLPAPGQHSTARDIARIARYAYFNSTLRQIVGTRNCFFQYANGRVRELRNTNKILGVNPYCNGMKTGFTNGAGHCLCASGTYNGQHVILVLMGSRPPVWRDADALLNWALAATTGG